MHTNELNSHEILTWGNTSGHCESPPPIIGEYCIDSPQSSRGIEAFFCDFEPTQSSPIGRARIVNLQLLSAYGLASP